MAEEEKEEQQEEQEAKEGKGSIVKWIIVAVAVVILGGGGVAGWYYYTSSDRNGGGQGEQIVQTPGIWSLGSVVVNLMDDNGERYLKTTIQIEVSSQECVEELELLKPKVMDSVLVLLSSKNYKEIAGFEGKQALRDEIAVRLGRYLAKGEVRRVYFTEFLIQ